LQYWQTLKAYAERKGLPVEVEASIALLARVLQG
jgi:hypothetical protein